MFLPRGMASFFRRMVHRKRAEEELDAEVRGYFDAIADRGERGLQWETPEHVKEKVRDARAGAELESILRDARYALRGIRKAPGFALLAIVTLALGIGASTAVFTVVDSVLLEPLAYHDSGRLVAIWERVRFLSPDPTGPNLRHVDLWRKRATAFHELAVVRESADGLALGTEHPRLTGIVTSSPNLFDLLGVTPFLGRGFRSEDGVPGNDRVAILTWTLWKNMFEGDRKAVGRVVRIAGTPREIVGVLPAGFRFPNANSLRAFRSGQALNSRPEPAVFVPAAINLNELSWNGDYGNWVALGRLRPGVGIDRAEAQLASIEAQVVNEMPVQERHGPPGGLSVSLQPMREAMVGDSSRILWLLMAAVMSLMLIACTNLANAQLGRALSREREAAVRSALGASRWQLIQSSLAESLLLALTGGAAGVLLAAAGLSLFRHYSPLDLPRLAEVHLNTAVLLFALALTLGSCLLFGTIPALRFLRTGPNAALRQNDNRALGARQSHHLRTWLIGLQVFGSTALLLLTGLFSKSLLNLIQQDKGFDTAHVMAAEVDLSRRTYGEDRSRTAFDDAVLNNLRALPGVESAGMVSAMPLEGESWIEELRRVDRPNQDTPLLNLRWASPGYFESIHAKLLAGRFFEERDRNLASAVLSEAEAKAVWGNESPVGARIAIEGRKFTVIGVVADSRNTSLKTAPARMAYVHYKDRPPFATFFMVRGTHSGSLPAASIRQAIWARDPAATIARVKTLDSQVSDSLAPERFQTSVLIAFGSAALLLAMLGIYGVLSYMVAGRRQEIGVRMALGATKRKIFALTLGEAGIPVAVGLASGLCASIVAGRVVRNLLYGVEALDLWVSVIVAALFVSAALAAALLPARRAASIDPMQALRLE
jgi:predicted permease